MTTLSLNFNHSENISINIVDEFYQQEKLTHILNVTMQYMVSLLNGESDSCAIDIFPYFDDLAIDAWKKPLELDIYLTDPIEGKALNFEARGKDYATNVLSYPSDLPSEVISLLPTILLGELVMCHEVMEKQANEQQKMMANHVTHLLVHGTLHLLGFDHELGELQQQQMENFEIEILKKLDVANPYIS